MPQCESIGPAITDLVSRGFLNGTTFIPNDFNDRADEFTVDLNGKIIDAWIPEDGVTCYKKKDIVGKSVSILYEQADRLNKIYIHDLEKAKKKDCLTTFGQRIGNNHRVFWARMDFISLTKDGCLKGFKVKIFDMEKSSSTLLKTNENYPFSKLPIPTRSGYVFVEFFSIVRCESEVNYTIFHLIDGSKIIACRSMRQFEEVLIGANFIRIHKSDIINLKHIKSYSKTSGGVVMDDNSELSLSRTFKQNLVEKLNLDFFDR
jgi:two-component system LytT family response regulator